MQSAAYDLSIYEPKPKRQAEQSPKVRVVAQRSQEELTRPKMLAKAVGLVVLLIVSLCMLLYSNAVLTELSDQVAEAQEKHQMLLAENERLQTSIESRMSLRNIEDIAKNELRLSELEPYQVTYVNRCGGDKIVTNESTPAGASILEEIPDTIGSVLEYLRISFNKN